MSTAEAFRHGVRTAVTSVFVLVLFATYIGFGALCHDLGFTPGWAFVSTVLVWAGPAQVVSVAALGSGSTLLQAALAVTVTGMRLLPMVATIMPVIKGPRTGYRHLLLPAHFTAVSMWVEAQRTAPTMPRERRVAFCNGIGVGLMAPTCCATMVGFFLAAKMPPVIAAAVLFLTPISFLVSTSRNSKRLVDRLALGFGLILAPIFATMKFELNLLAAGVAAGTLAYLINRFWGRGR